MRTKYTDKELTKMNSRRLSDLWYKLFWVWDFRTRGKDIPRIVESMNRAERILDRRGIF